MKIVTAETHGNKWFQVAANFLNERTQCFSYSYCVGKVLFIQFSNCFDTDHINFIKEHMYMI